MLQQEIQMLVQLGPLRIMSVTALSLGANSDCRFLLHCASDERHLPHVYVFVVLTATRLTRTNHI